MPAQLLGAVAITLSLCGCSSSSSAATSLKTHAHPGTALAGVGTLPTPASAWPEAGFDARRSSATMAVGPQQGHLLWKRSLAGDATPGPVIGIDGSVLAATNNGVLHGLDPRTGSERWTFNSGRGYGSDLSTSPAVLADGTILWPGPGNTLFALDRFGKRQWSEAFSAQVLSPAVAGNNRVYVATMDGHLNALEITARSHRIVWTVDVHGTDYGSPTVGPEGNIYTVSDNCLVAVRDRGSSGTLLWQFQARKMVEVSNGVAPDGTVVLGTNHDREYGIGPDGKVRWSHNIGDYTYSSSIVRPDGTACFGDNSDLLHVVSATTGRTKPTIDPLGSGKEKIWTSAVVDAQGNIYWASTTGNVYGYTKAGKQLFALHTPIPGW